MGSHSNKTMKQSNKYWANVRKQYAKNKRALFAAYIVLFLSFIAVFADFLANNKPILMKYQDNWYSPVLKEYTVSLGIGKWSPDLVRTDFKTLKMDFAIWSPIRYLPTNPNYNSIYVRPFSENAGIGRHWLGTDKLGRDVAAGMVHGTRIAFSVGVVAMGISFFIGVFLGTIAGYFGDDRLKISRIRLLLNLLFLPLAFFYAFMVRSDVLGDSFAVSLFTFIFQFLLSLLFFIGILLIPNLLTIPLKRIRFLGKKISLPLDIILTRFIEVVVSVPVLVLILVVIAIAKPSIYNVMIIIGLFGWPGIARFVRAELMKIRRLEYIEAADALGFSHFRTMFKHAVPNALSPVFISVAFGVAAAILIEAFLSFLGIGVPSDMITWGKLLNLSRGNSSAWWLAVFPGFAIFITVTVFNLIGEGLTDALDPKLRK
jgi:peptide/nickel transport system permease protein